MGYSELFEFQAEQGTARELAAYNLSWDKLLSSKEFTHLFITGEMPEREPDPNSRYSGFALIAKRQMLKGEHHIDGSKGTSPPVGSVEITVVPDLSGLLFPVFSAEGKATPTEEQEMMLKEIVSSFASFREGDDANTLAKHIRPDSTVVTFFTKAYRNRYTNSSSADAGQWLCELVNSLPRQVYLDKDMLDRMTDSGISADDVRNWPADRPIKNEIENHFSKYHRVEHLPRAEDAYQRFAQKVHGCKDIGNDGLLMLCSSCSKVISGLMTSARNMEDYKTVQRDGECTSCLLDKKRKATIEPILTNFKENLARVVHSFPVYKACTRRRLEKGSYLGGARTKDVFDFRDTEVRFLPHPKLLRSFHDAASDSTATGASEANDAALGVPANAAKGETVARTEANTKDHSD
jgi:hypothetical protein